MNRLVGFLLILFFFTSCTSDDDICVSGEATPRMKVNFRDFEGNRELQVDTLFVAVDYGEGKKDIIAQAKVDSIFIPLRVDNANATDVYVKTRTEGEESHIKISYQTDQSYVSPACGFKKLYKEVSLEIDNIGPVRRVDQLQPEIINEDNAHFTFVF